MDRRGKKKVMVMTGDRQSTHRRPGTGKPVHQDANSKRASHVRRQYKKLKKRLGGEVKTYDLEALEALQSENAIPSTSGEDRSGLPTPEDERDLASGKGRAGTSVPPRETTKADARPPRRNRTKEKKGFFKKTRSGQPVMKTRIDKLLNTIQSLDATQSS